MSARDLRERLVRRGRRAGVSLDDRLVADLEAYFRLLATWNVRINLTGLPLDDASSSALDRLLIEPVAAARHAPVRTARVMDLGSGGGSPAIPFALALGAVRLRMVESKARKSVFLREAIRTLGMASAEVLTARYEELLGQHEYQGQEDLLTVRAVRVDPATLSAIQTLVRPGGQLFLFVSATPGGTLSVPSGLTHVATVPLVEALGSELTILRRDRLPRPASLTG